MKPLPLDVIFTYIHMIQYIDHSCRVILLHLGWLKYVYLNLWICGDDGDDGDDNEQ